MRRSLFVAFFAAQYMVFGSIPCLSADDPAAHRPSQRKAAIEKMLDSPLKWELGDREHVTLADLIKHIREEHQLQVRWDVGSLGLIFGDDAPLGEFFSSSLTGQASTPQLMANAYPGVSSTNPYGQTHPQPSSTYGAPSAAGVAQAPIVQGYATGSTKPTQTPKPNYQATAGVLQAPGTAQVASNSSSKQQPAPQVALAQGAVPNSDKPALDLRVPDAPVVTGPAAAIAKYQTSPVSLSAVSLERATVREALQQLLEGVSVHTSAIPFQAGLPITTRALTLDLLVDENSVLITTQLRANARKETRIYRLGSLSEIPIESLERVITHSIRPWSWRSQANEIAGQLASRWPKSSVPLPNIELSTTDGITLKPSDTGAALSTSAMPAVSADTVAATGQLVAGGALALVNSIVAAFEIVHHGDPPTGVIESLPGVLIITQSQGAHREIKELLHELGEEE